MVGERPDSPLPGYLSPDYGYTFREFGEIVTLPNSGIQLIRRDIGEDKFDLAGLYPYTMCRNWSTLREDDAFLHETGAVSVVLVGDPLETEEAKRATERWTFNRRFKTHFGVDLRQDWRQQRTKKVRYYTRRGLKWQNVEIVKNTSELADELWALYENTILRHDVTGIQRLSRNAVAGQLEVDGIMLIVARDENAMTGALLGYQHGLSANLHLLFLSLEAYELNTTYALYYSFLAALEERGCRYVNLGGAAGLSEVPSDGLSAFKKKWSNDQRATALCGNILNGKAYGALASEIGLASTDFFPAYRAPGGPYEWS